MTDEQINIKIAELCGWKPWIVLYPGRSEQGWKKGRVFRKRPPNYAADLNACHEFEKTLSPGQQYNYVHAPAMGGNAFMATARQRCEAFLRVHGQWEEEV